MGVHGCMPVAARAVLLSQVAHMDALAVLAFDAMGTDLAAIALPALFMRLVLSPSFRMQDLLSALALAGLSLALFRDGRGTWLSLCSVALAQAASLYATHARRRLSTAALLLAASMCWAAPSFSIPASSNCGWAHAGGILVACALASSMWPWLAPRATLDTLSIGVAIAAASLPMVHLTLHWYAALPAELADAVRRALSNLLPLHEFGVAYSTASLFMGGASLEGLLSSLALTTIHCQIGLGYLGVAYLRAAQRRKNSLLSVGRAAQAASATRAASAHRAASSAASARRATSPRRGRAAAKGSNAKGPNAKGEGEDEGEGDGDGDGDGDGEGGRPEEETPSGTRVTSTAFARSVGRFVLITAAPYMLQRTCLESINSHIERRFLDHAEDALRLHVLLADGSSLDTVGTSNHTVDSHVEGLRAMLQTPFNLAERKLFSLPKLALVPAVLGKHPLMVALGMPVAILVDAGKSALVARITRGVEVHRRAQRRLESRRSRIEAFDTQVSQ